MSHGTTAASPQDVAAAPLQAANRPDEPAGRPLPSDPAALLFPAEAAHILGLSPRTLEHFRISGGGPHYVSIGRRCVRYRRDDLISWIESRRRRHTSASGPTSEAVTRRGE